MTALGSTWQAGRKRAAAATARLVERLPRRLRSLLQRLANRELMAQASSLAFFGLVSALPLIMLTLALVGAMAGEQTVQRFVEQASSTGPEGSSQFLEQLTRNGGSFTLATVVFTLWPATAYGGGLRRALVRASGQEEAGSGLRGRVRALALILLLPALVLAGLPFVFVLTALSGDGPAATVLAWVLALAGATSLGGIITAMLYHAFAPTDFGWRGTAAGALLTSATTALFSAGFVVYLRVADTEERFGGGTIAIVVLLGVWLFVANALLLAGYQAVLTVAEEEP